MRMSAYYYHTIVFLVNVFQIISKISAFGDNQFHVQDDILFIFNRHLIHQSITGSH